MPAHVITRVPDLLDGLSEDRELVFLSSSAQVAQLVPVSELRVSRVGRA
ncbi:MULTISPECIES: hypothetical protein [unclassified Streptomyces]